MKEELKEEAKALIDSGKYEEAKKKIDELIAMQPAPALDGENLDKNEPDEVPLPGTGTGGVPVK